MTEREQRLIDYIQNSYPTWLRDEISDEASIIWKYDFVRSYTLAAQEEVVQNGVNQLLVQTATNAGLTEWELFLYMPVNPGLSDSFRRAAITSKLSWSQWTLKNIKDLITSVIWGDVAGFTVEEAWKQPGFVAANTWDYTVRIFQPATGWNQADLVTLLEQIQPAHCNLIIDIIPSVVDALWVTDATASGKHTWFVWADAWAPTGSDMVWSSDSTPLVWSIWS